MPRTTSPRLSLPPGALRLLSLCVVAIVLAFGVTEVLLRAGLYTRPRWYPRVIETLDGRPARFLFIGSSRVSAAIDVRRFAALTGTSESLCLNVGQGFSTVTAHALGIRALAGRGLLRGTTVFIEAPQGVVDPSTWTTPWYQIEGAHFLMSVLEGRDLPALWRSTQPVEGKLAATGRWVFKPAWISIYREDIRVRALSGLYGAAGLSSALPPDDERGVRRDMDDLSRIRAAAVENGRLAALAPVVTDWTATVTASIVRQVQASGGEVVFYRMPMSRQMEVTSRSVEENARTLAVQADRWNVRVLQPRVTFSEADFPDLWHLSAPASVPFTEALVEAWRAR